MYKYILIILATFIVTSCIPSENPVKPYDRGGVLSSSVTMGPNYTNQVFYSFDQSKFLTTNDIYTWDLGFSCKDSSNDIILNFAKFMKVADLGLKPFSDVTNSDIDNITAEQWIFDAPSGNLDSTAIGKWWEYKNGNVASLGKVYIIDRGTNEIGKKWGFVKFQILEYNSKVYKVAYASLKDNVSHEFTVTKNSEYNFSYLSFEKAGNLLQIEPLKDQWDIIFSKYTELLTAGDTVKMWYSVTGAYLNPNKVEAVLFKDTSFTFKSLDNRVLDTIKLFKTRNVIGHDWKKLPDIDGKFKVNPNMIYIIKSVSGFYYKLHFMDFYIQGVKGSPVFEFQKL